MPSRATRLNRWTLAAEMIETDELTFRVRRNTPRVAGSLLAIAATSEIARRLLNLSDHVALRVAAALVAGVRTWCLVMGLIILVFGGTAAITIALNRRFPNRSPRTSIFVLSAFLFVVVLVCFFFVPMCLGSLKEGTYDCVTFAERAAGFARGV